MQARDVCRAAGSALGVALGLVCLRAGADVRLPGVFSDHMVLQRDASVPVWGWANPGEAVKVAFDGATRQATAGSDGRWRIDLPPMLASEKPRELTVAGKNTVVVRDVLVGDVWLCSGQSNMGFTMDRASTYAADQPRTNLPGLRQFMVDHTVALRPQSDCKGRWQSATPDTLKGFSAVAFYFGRGLHEKLHVPIGLINSSWGGTRAATWVSLPGLRAAPELKPLVDEYQGLASRSEQELRVDFNRKTLPAWQKQHDEWTARYAAPYKAAVAQWVKDSRAARAAGQPEPPRPQLAVREPARPVPPLTNQQNPTFLNNAMIHPLMPFRIKGAVWYQGESDAGNWETYRTLLPALVTDWRRSWGQGDFPFLVVQLPNYYAKKADPNAASAWACLRESQTAVLKLPKTALAVTIDLGVANDIHPTDKVDVGDRLVAAALPLFYNAAGTPTGPVYAGMAVAGDRVRVRFESVAGGLTNTAPLRGMARAEGSDAPGLVRGFALAGADHVFHPAEARIQGGSVVVWSDAVKAPVAVRYAWADNPDATLYNRAGLPAAPFRSDDWPVK